MSSLYVMVMSYKCFVQTFNDISTCFTSYCCYYKCKTSFLIPDLLWVLACKKELPVTSRMLVYKILSTLNIDPLGYYKCKTSVLIADLLWVLARKKELPVTSRVLVYDILSTLNIDPSRLTLTKHNKCPKF